MGDDAVLLAMDDKGLAAVDAALREAAALGAAELKHGDVTHLFRVKPEAADIEFDDTRVLWRLDAAKVAEIRADLKALSNGPGHHYVDIRTPADTLLLSVGEYVGAADVTADP